MTKSMSRDDVLRVVSEARAKGERPDLRGVDLHGVDLRDADLRDANLRSADLRGTNLRDAALRDANLRGADLRGADLRGADLRYADLRYADLRYADLRYADLRYAALRGADLWCADLRDVLWDGLFISRLPSGQLTLTPTCDGWRLSIGCWTGTPDQLRNLIAQDEGWPEAVGEEITRRRPYMQAALALCEVHMADHANAIDNLKERWGDQ